jgi:hypothetical protein
MMTIPCRKGTIHPHGAEMLALGLDGHPKVAKQLATIPGIVLHQDGGEEKTFLFPVSLFDQVAALVEPKRVRRLSDLRPNPGANQPSNGRVAVRSARVTD